KTRRATTGIELRDGQSFALAGLLDNNETRTMSKVPGIGDLPIIGNLFKSKSFQKDETELMFFVTAQLVHPVGRDELPQMKGLDGLRGASPLGVEPKGEGIKGASGYSTIGDGASTVKTDAAKADAKPAEANAPAAPAAAAPAPAKDATKDAVKEAPKADAPKTEATKTEASGAAVQLPARGGVNVPVMLTTQSVARVAPPPNHK
ncbi:MAG: hypothetical protein ABR554_08745, partial [Pyrinomonadaceae bacterium]